MVAQNTISTKDVKLEYLESGDYIFVDGIGGVTENSSEAPSTTTTTFQGSSTVTGSKPVSTISFDVPSHNPQLECWKTIRTNMIDSKPMTWRLSRPEIEIADPGSRAMAAIAVDGECTFTGMGNLDFTADQYGAGLALQTGTGDSVKNWIINSITVDNSGVATVTVGNKPESAVTATEYKLVLPELRTGFGASVSDYTYIGTFNLDGNISASMTVAPSAHPPAIKPENLGS